MFKKIKKGNLSVHYHLMIYWNGSKRLGARVTAHCKRPDVDVVQQQGHTGQRASRLSAACYWRKKKDVHGFQFPTLIQLKEQCTVLYGQHSVSLACHKTHRTESEFNFLYFFRCFGTVEYKIQ